jgi:hypothetical protein
VIIEKIEYYPQELLIIEQLVLFLKTLKAKILLKTKLHGYFFDEVLPHVL